MSPRSHPHYLGHSRDLTLSISLVLLSLELALPRVSSVELALYISSSIYPYICLSLYISRDLSFISLFISFSPQYVSIFRFYPLDLILSIALSTSILRSISLSANPPFSLSLSIYHYLYICITISDSVSVSLSRSLSQTLNITLDIPLSRSIFRAKFLHISRASSSSLFMSYSRYLTIFLSLSLQYISLSHAFNLVLALYLAPSLEPASSPSFFLFSPLPTPSSPRSRTTSHSFSVSHFLFPSLSFSNSLANSASIALSSSS